MKQILFGHPHIRKPSSPHAFSGDLMQVTTGPRQKHAGMTAFARIMFFAFFLLTIPSFASPSEQPLDEVVATVNDNVITKVELKQALYIARQQMANSEMPKLADKALRKQVLEHLINTKIQLDLAKIAGVSIEDKELDKTISMIAKENNMPVDEFYSKISQEGLSVKQNYKKEIRESLTLQRLQRQEVAAHISITPDEINNYMHSAEKFSSGDKEYHVFKIYSLPISDTPSPEDIAIAKKFAEDLIYKLQKGIKLKELDPGETEALQDNDLSWRKLAEIPSAFTDTVQHMGANDFAGPVQTSNGFHIVHLLATRTDASHIKKPEKRQVAELIFQHKYEEA